VRPPHAPTRTISESTLRSEVGLLGSMKARALPIGGAEPAGGTWCIGRGALSAGRQVPWAVPSQPRNRRRRRYEQPYYPPTATSALHPY